MPSKRFLGGIAACVLGFSGLFATVIPLVEAKQPRTVAPAKPQNLFEQARKSVVSIEIDGDINGTGVAVIRGKDIYIWTVAHVLPPEGPCPGCGETHELGISKRIEHQDVLVGRMYASVEVLKRDEVWDLALLRVTSPFPIAGARFAWEGPELGAPIFHIGNAAGAAAEETLFRGHLAKIARQISIMVRPLDQSDFDILGGCSGGPVFNSEGHIIGLMDAARVDNMSFSYYIPLRDIREWARANDCYFAVFTPLW